MTTRNSHPYIDYLYKLLFIHVYNSTYHRSICKMPIHTDYADCV